MQNPPDPTPDKRVYYRNQSGDLGYLVTRDGRQRVRLDRPMVDEHYPLDERWTPDHDHRPLAAHQLSDVAYWADQRLCFHLGLRAPRDWKSLSDTERIAFMQNGPKSTAHNHARKRMFLAITGSIQDLAK